MVLAEAIRIELTTIIPSLRFSLESIRRGISSSASARVSKLRCRRSILQIRATRRAAFISRYRVAFESETFS